jgi:hypothetical protein
MAEIRCTNCGNNNPDFLDVCQFCQTPLEHEATVHIGEEPTKKDTGELEEVLPDWLKDARKQGKNEEAADDAFRSQPSPRFPKEEPPDLLAGLMSQADSDEDEVPDWLASINPVAEKKSPISKPTAEDESSDFFSQFREAENTPPASDASEPEQDAMSWMGMEETSAGQKEKPTEGFSQPSADETSSDDDWMKGFASFDASKETPAAEKELEDLSWLHDLEASSQGTGDLSTPQTNAIDSASSSSSSSSDEDLGWLNNLGGTPAPSFEESTPSRPSSSDEDLGWLSNLGGMPAPSSEETAPQSSDEDLSWLDNFGGTPVSSPSQPEPIQPSSSNEDLSWLNNLGGESVTSPEEPASSQSASSDEDLSWLDNLGGTPTSASTQPESEQPSSPGEELDWLNKLDSTPAPAFDESVSSQPVSSDEDLSWLNNLGDTPAPSSKEPVPSQSASSDEDLSWLDSLGGTPTPTSEEPVSAQPTSSGEDLDWLNNLGGTPISSEMPTVKPSTPSEDDMSWLNDLGGGTPALSDEPEPSQPSSTDDNLDWLGNLAGTSEPSAPAFADTGQLNSMQETPDTPKPFRTAPLHELIGDEGEKDSTPDWLKNAMEEPSMPAPGAVSMDWFSEHSKSADAENVPTQEEPASPQAAFDFSISDSSSASTQDVDSLFDIEMPDWLSQEPESPETSQPEAAIPAEDDTLSPVELPSWVQAMRPVDSAIDDSTASTVDQVTEREGPLAGFRGVIPASPIGSSLRPKAFSLKLQITEEQQASATLLEQLIAGEKILQPPKETTGISSPNVLRWALSVLFLVVLGTVLGLGSRWMPIVPSNELSDLVVAIPASSPVLVVVDYEPSFSGEMEASAGPLLDQLALSRQSAFTFVSMSPNASALVERLMLDTGINGLGYQPGAQYFNLGFLPGGSAGVLGFIENPADKFASFEAVILMTDNAETGRVWVEQLDFAKGKFPSLAGKPLIVVSSAQSAPLLQPYVSSGQVDLMVNGLADAAKFEYVNNTRPGIARSYWDAFGIGLTMAVIAIILGSIWSVFMQIRERRAEAEQG